MVAAVAPRGAHCRPSPQLSQRRALVRSGRCCCILCLSPAPFFLPGWTLLPSGHRRPRPRRPCTPSLALAVGHRASFRTPAPPARPQKTRPRGARRRTGRGAVGASGGCRRCRLGPDAAPPRRQQGAAAWCRRCSARRAPHRARPRAPLRPTPRPQYERLAAAAGGGPAHLHRRPQARPCPRSGGWGCCWAGGGGAGGARRSWPTRPSLPHPRAGARQRQQRAPPPGPGRRRSGGAARAPGAPAPRSRPAPCPPPPPTTTCAAVGGRGGAGDALTAPCRGLGFKRRRRRWRGRHRCRCSPAGPRCSPLAHLPALTCCRRRRLPG